MGAGGSVPASLDEAKAKELAGDHFDQKLFDSLAEEDFATCKPVVTKDQFLEAAKAKGLGVGGGGASATAGAGSALL